MQPPAQQMPLGNQAGIDWKFGLRGALFAGVLLAVASLNPLLFVGLMLLAAGAFAVFYYQHKTSQPLSTSDGAKIGAVAGLFAGLLLCISIALQFFVGGLSSTMRSYMQQSAAQNNDPNVQAMVQKLNTPEGMAALVMAILMIALFGSIAVCCAGGAIGAAKFGKRKDR